MMLAVGFHRCWFYIDALYWGEEILFCEKLTLPKERSGLYPQLLEVTFMPVGVFVCLGTLSHTGTIQFRVGALGHTVSVDLWRDWRLR